MRSFRLDPYLWVHLAGLAAVPLWLDICLLGLATGEPVLPTWLELALVAGFGILPVAWMQWRRPFCIFSLVFLSLRPDRLSEDRRRLLRLFKDPLVKFVTALAPVPLLWALNKLYMLAPLAADLTPFGLGGRWLGLLVAAIAFLLANLFVQVPLSVVRVLLTPQRVFDQLPPYAPEQVRQDFTLLGIRINQILPDWQALDVVQPVSAAGPTVRPPVTEPAAASEDVFEQVISSDPVSEDYIAGDRDVSAGADLPEAAADERATVETVAETIAEAAEEGVTDEDTTDARAFDSIDMVQTASAEEISATEVQLTAPKTAEPEPERAATVESLAETHAPESLPPEPAAAAEPEQAAQIPEIAALAEAAAEDLEALADEAADAAQPAQLEPLPGDSGAGPEAATAAAAPLHTANPAAAGDGHSEQPTPNSHGSHALPGEPPAIAPLEIAVNPYFDPAAPAEVGDPPPTHPG
jgi:hypothetical protein